MKTLIFCAVSSISTDVIYSLFNQVQTKGDDFDIVFAARNPYRGDEAYRNVQMKYEQMRKLAIDGAYDKVWIVEHDTIPPIDALAKMLAVSDKAHIVTGLYALRHAEPVPNIMRWQIGSDIGSSMEWGDVQRSWGEVIRCTGGCMGCLLVDVRDVLQYFPTFMMETATAPDMKFMSWCYLNGYRTLAHLGVVCGHQKPNGDIIHCSRTQKVGYTLERFAERLARESEIVFHTMS